MIRRLATVREDNQGQQRNILCAKHGLQFSCRPPLELIKDFARASQLPLSYVQHLFLSHGQLMQGRGRFIEEHLRCPSADCMFENGCGDLSESWLLSRFPVGIECALLCDAREESCVFDCAGTGQKRICYTGIGLHCHCMFARQRIF